MSGNADYAIRPLLGVACTLKMEYNTRERYPRRFLLTLKAIPDVVIDSTINFDKRRTVHERLVAT